VGRLSKTGYLRELEVGEPQLEGEERGLFPLQNPTNQCPTMATHNLSSHCHKSAHCSFQLNSEESRRLRPQFAMQYQRALDSWNREVPEPQIHKAPSWIAFNNLPTTGQPQFHKQNDYISFERASFIHLR
jgi:hypothetical protein